MVRLHILAALILAAVAAGQEPLDCKGGEERTENPLGTCTCDGHLWVAPGCTEGYFCADNTGRGCYKECADGLFISPDFTDSTWDCFDPDPTKDGTNPLVKEEDDRVIRRCPFSGYNVCTGSTDVEPTPPGPITENPLGYCHCNGELWVSEGCSFGFFCDDTIDIGGTYLSCPEDQTIIVNATSDPISWECTTNTDTCPGGPVEGVGCIDYDCVLALNPLGECECEGQMFLNDECTEGFLCTSNIVDSFIYDGCIKRCFENEKLVPDYDNGGWICIPEDEAFYLCPGKFNLECPENSIGHDLDSSMCDCSGQLIMSGDCKEAFYCIGHIPGGGNLIKCPDTDDIILYDFVEKEWECVPETSNNCPALGGFKLGCYGSEVEVPEPDCTFDKNTFGECDGCEGQIFINDDCSESFYCTKYIPDGEDADGCLLSCAANERVHVDYALNIMECVEREESFICPGLFHVDCDDAFNNLQCHCDTELWMSKDCEQAFICEAEATVQGSNQGQTIACEGGQVISVDFTDILNWQCVDDASTCPGSFHFGCESEDLQNTLQPPESTTSEPGTGQTTEPAPGPGSGAGISEMSAAVLVVVLVAALNIM